jgi:hypothetical protein
LEGKVVLITGASVGTEIAVSSKSYMRSEITIKIIVLIRHRNWQVLCMALRRRRFKTYFNR